MDFKLHDYQKGVLNQFSEKADADSLPNFQKEFLNRLAENANSFSFPEGIGKTDYSSRLSAHIEEMRRNDPTFDEVIKLLTYSKDKDLFLKTMNTSVADKERSFWNACGLPTPMEISDLMEKETVRTYTNAKAEGTRLSFPNGIWDEINRVRSEGVIGTAEFRKEDDDDEEDCIQLSPVRIVEIDPHREVLDLNVVIRRSMRVNLPRLSNQVSEELFTEIREEIEETKLVLDMTHRMSPKEVEQFGTVDNDKLNELDPTRRQLEAHLKQEAWEREKLFVHQDAKSGATRKKNRAKNKAARKARRNP